MAPFLSVTTLLFTVTTLETLELKNVDDHFFAVQKTHQRFRSQ